MTKSPVFIFLALLVSSLAVITAGDALAQSSLGIGRAEPKVPTGGLFEDFFTWVRSYQAEFHQSIKSILVAMRNDGTHLWSLVGIAFAYGVFHAIGPGHGKVVVSSYMLANEVAMRRGILISMAASIAQGITAILAIAVFMLALRGIVKTDELTFGLEIASYVAVMAIGLWLLWRKLFRRGHDHLHSHGQTHDQHHHEHAHSHSHAHEGHGHEHHHHDHDHHGHGVVCDHCGHAHMPDPKLLEGNRFGLREAWSTILAVGLRPCTGALIILVFCFANGLFLAGVLSTFAMSIGTGLAVSGMAILAVTAKNAALKLSGFQDKAAIVHQSIEVLGASFIFMIGLVLFYASITA